MSRNLSIHRGLGRLENPSSIHNAPGSSQSESRYHDPLSDGRRARVLGLQARPVVHAREDPRVLDPDDPDVRRHRGDHPLDLPAGGLRVVPVVLSPACLLSLSYPSHSLCLG